MKHIFVEMRLEDILHEKYLKQGPNCMFIAVHKDTMEVRFFRGGLFKGCEKIKTTSDDGSNLEDPKLFKTDFLLFEYRKRVLFPLIKRVVLSNAAELEDKLRDTEIHGGLIDVYYDHEARQKFAMNYAEEHKLFN